MVQVNFKAIDGKTVFKFITFKKKKKQSLWENRQPTNHPKQNKIKYKYLREMY